MADNARAVTAVTQLCDLAGRVDAAALDKPTPCAEWSVADLLDHVLVSTGNFTAMAQGGEAEWAAEAPQVENRAAAVREAGNALVNALAADDATPIPLAVPEFALHTWDLSQALGCGTDQLDPDVAIEGLEFMRSQLTVDNRAPAFGPEQPAPSGGTAYDTLAAFAGRSAD